jgi:hypothetical protein
MELLQRIDNSKPIETESFPPLDVKDMNTGLQSFMQMKVKTQTSSETEREVEYQGLLHCLLGGEAVILQRSVDREREKEKERETEKETETESEIVLSRLEIGLAIDAVGISHYPQVILLAAIKLLIDRHLLSPQQSSSTSPPAFVDRFAAYMQLSRHKQPASPRSILVTSIPEDDPALMELDRDMRVILHNVDYLLRVIERLKLNADYWPIVSLVDGHELQKVSCEYLSHHVLLMRVCVTM